MFSSRRWLIGRSLFSVESVVLLLHIYFIRFAGSEVNTLIYTKCLMRDDIITLGPVLENSASRGWGLESPGHRG